MKSNFNSFQARILSELSQNKLRYALLTPLIACGLSAYGQAPCNVISGQNTIYGTLFDDNNSNGVLDPGETYHSGVTVFLYEDTNGNGVIDGGEPQIGSAVSNTNGEYQFDLPASVNNFNVRDEFDAIAFTGNNGTNNYSNDWQELGESNGTSSGELRVVSNPGGTTNALRFGLNNEDGLSMVGIGASRTADISIGDSATLSFDYFKNISGSAPSFTVDVEISADRTNWVTLDNIDWTDADQNYSYDITPYISATTSVRFIANGSRQDESSDYMYFDNVDISYSEFIYTPNVIAQLDPAVAGANTLTTPSEYPITFTGADQISCNNDFGYCNPCAPNAIDDYGVFIFNTPLSIEVTLNDLGDFDVNSVTTLAILGLLQPSNGTVQAGNGFNGIPFGTIVYTPNTGFSGVDSFEYRLCNQPFPFPPGQVCDVAKVYVTDCDASSTENKMGGVVFLEEIPDDGSYAIGETLKAGITVNLYEDSNCNGALDAGENTPINTTVTGVDGRYSFSVNDMGVENVRDEFNANGSAAGNNGSQNWASSWTETGESDGFGSGDIQVISNQLRVQDNDNGGEGAQRIANLSNATAATLTYDYSESGLDNANDFVAVSISTDGSSWTEVARHHGGDAITSGSETIDITAYISSTTYVRMLSSSSLGGSDIVFFDNVDINYTVSVNPRCYITQVDLSDQNSIYSKSTLDQGTVTFNALGTCNNTQDLGLLAVVDAIDDVALVIDVPVSINVIANDTGVLDTSSILITTGPTDGTVMINPDGSITYTPGGSYVGSDMFQYEICSADDPGVCDIATVTITDCDATPTENKIGGIIFLEVPAASDDGVYTFGEPIQPGFTVHLYNDDNCNGMIDGGDVVQQTAVSDANGRYDFSVSAVGCYTTQIDFSDKNGAYAASMLSMGMANFATLGACESKEDLGVIAVMIAVDDSFNVIIDLPTVLQVLSNDMGAPDSSMLTTGGSLVEPLHGSIIVNGDGTITYTPDFSYTGLDQFQYEICSTVDTSVCDIATVKVNVTCPGIIGQNTIYGSVFNDLNINGNYDGVAESYSGSAVTINLYTDDNGNGLIDDGATPTTTTTDGSGNYQFVVANMAGQYIVEVVNATLPAGAVNTTQTTRSVVFGSGDLASCSNNFGFSLCTDCPPIAIDDNQSVSQGVPAFFNVLENDIETTNPFDLSSFAIVSQPTNGSLVLGANGQVTYIPNGSFIGSDVFTYRICDSGSPAKCDTANVNILIEEDLIDPCAEAIKTHTYYLPFPAENLYDALRGAISCPGNLGNILRTVISIKVPYPGITIIYDHWEDGYENDLQNPIQGTTEVWGDGDLTNGIAPGYSNDLIPSGGDILLDNTYNYNPRSAADIVFDAKDKIFTTSDVAISEISGDINSFTFQTAKTDVYDVNRFGNSFTVSFGEDLPNEFQYTSLFIRAAENNTIVTVDVDADGMIDTTGTGIDVITSLNEGEVLFIDGGVLSGAQIIATKPVGVDILFGGLDCYGTRNINLLPGQFYGSTYYTPVPTTNNTAPAAVYFYNSLNNSITINWTSTSSSGNFTVPAGSTFKYTIPLSNSGYKFESVGGESYTAVEVIDSDANGAAFDWAFGLISEARLTSFASLAWGPGSLDGTRNDNPVWVTAVDATTLYVKYDGALDTTGVLTSPCGVPYDVSFDVSALELVRLLDASDNDQSGLAVYTCDGTKLAAVYGEDPSTALVGSPSLDVGTAIQPMCLDELIFANDDYVTSLPNYVLPETEFIIVDVLLNDEAFLTDVDPITVATAGLLQPANGTTVVNMDGTITYTPNAGFLGEDVFEYRVCATTDPDLCDIAKVYVNVTDCDAEPNENVINGFVYVEKTPDDSMYTDESKILGSVVVHLYDDANCNGMLDAGEIILESKITDATGNYRFTTINGDNVKDDFEASNVINGGNDGTVNWDNNWQEIGETNGFTTPNVSIGVDGVFGNKLILSGANKGASRDITFSGANFATLYFDYRRDSLNDVGEELIVRFNGAIIFTVDDGDTTGTDPDYTTTAVISIPSANINPNSANTLSFTTNGSTNANDRFYVDNVVLDFNNGEVCFVTQVDPTSSNGAYSAARLNQRAISFTTLGTCANDNSLGVLANLIANDDVYDIVINTPQVLDILNNDIGEPDPLTVLIVDSPMNGMLSVNPDGTVTYTPNAGYMGSDFFTYTVCSIEDPGICDTAVVNLQIGCEPIDGQNTIFGGVFTDVDANGSLDTPEVYDIAGVTVRAYVDANGNGLIDDGSPPIIGMTDANGVFRFDLPFIEFTANVRDEFNTNGLGTGNDGDSTWTNSWQEIGESNGLGSGDIQVITNQLRVKDNNNGGGGAYRTADLTGATTATLSYDYQESGLENSDFVAVYVSNVANPDPSPGSSDWVLLATYDGVGADDSGSENIDISSYISSTTSIRFLGSSGLGNNDIVFFDNVNIEYNQISFDPDYIIEIDTNTFPSDYVPTTVIRQTVHFSDINQAICDINFGATASNLITVKTLSSTNPTPIEGDLVEFTITVTNDGPGNNTVISLVDSLPTGITYVGSTPSVGTYDSGTGFWGSFDLAVGASETLVLSGTIDAGMAGMTITNITTAASGDLPDSDDTGDDLEEAIFVLVPIIAVNDSATTDSNTPVTADVLSNDIPGTNPIDPSSVDTIAGGGPVNGTVVVNGDGTIDYTPDPYFNGVDSFMYVVCDSTQPVAFCDTATVVVTVTATPLTAVDDTETTDSNTPVTADVLSNDIPGTNPIDPSSVDTIAGGGPVNGTVVVNGDGTIDYTPDAYFNGVDSFMYVVCDSTQPVAFCDTATVVVTVTGDAINGSR